MSPENRDPVVDTERPPMVATWKRLYALVLGLLGLLIALMYVFMRAFT